MPSPRAARSVPTLWVSAILAALVVVVFPMPASAAGTTLFNRTFHNNTLGSGTGAVVIPAVPSGSNTVCLTAAGAPTGAVPPSCAVATDVNGSGKLRLTNNNSSQRGGLFGATSFPTSQGLDVTFTTYQYGTTTTPADGIAFVLAAVDPNNPAAPAAIGYSGGSLGYSASGTNVGLVGAYLGIGFDVFGNFSNKTYEGSGCTDPTNMTTAQKGQVVVRGPGNGTVGYCGVTTTATAATGSPVIALRATSRAASAVPVEVVLNPTAGSLTTASGLTVAANSYLVAFTPVGGTARTLTGTLPQVPSGLYPSSTWTNTNGIPRQLAFGWVGSTGGSVDYHEIDNASVVTLATVPTLTVSQLAYSVATPAAGAPVTYIVTGAVGSDQDETAAVTVTETVPAGVTPLGASGTGWVCQPPTGQYVACTNSNGPFTKGSTLPPITVNAVVNTSGVTAARIQSASTVVASSNDANPGYAPSAAAGTTPTAPSGIALSPASGPTAGGSTITVTGSEITGATAIEVGTTAEFAAGTPTIVLPCSTALTSGCFSVSDSTLVITGMPAHAAGSVIVKVVTLGVAGSATYSYLGRPGAPTVTATAGVTSATVTWTVPANNGSAITGYVVTPYRDGVAQAALPVAANVTSTTFTGLSAGVPYTFTVAAVNAIGTGAAGSSAAVTPYTVTAAPTAVAAAASDSAATLSWTAPVDTGGSPITGYVVTPYLGATAGTPQTFNGAATTATVTGLTPGSTYTFRVAAVNAAGTGAASAASNAVLVNAAPSFTFPAPNDGEVGVADTISLSVADGTGPYTFSISSGALPAGMTLDAGTGVISGTPTTAGSYAFSARVTDAAGQSAVRPVTLTVVAAPTLNFPTPQNGEVGVVYSAPLDVTGGAGPYSWAIAAGSLPAGLTLDAGTGVISGTPTTAGTASFTVRVTDAGGQVASTASTLTIVAQQRLSFAAPPSGEVGVAYNSTLVGSGGANPLRYTLTSGTLPAGLTLTVAGVLSGTPTTAGNYVVVIRVRDALNRTSTQTVTLDINAAPVLDFTAPANGEVGVPYSDTLSVVGGTGPISWAITAGSLPAGLTLNTGTGEISGTPTAAGSASFTVRVTDASAVADSAATTLRVVAAPSLALPALPTGDVGQDYTTTLEVDGGTGPYTWAVGTGSLPAGLTLDGGTGVLSGTPTASGSFPVTVRVTDANGVSASQAVTVVIRAVTAVALSTSQTTVSFGSAVTLTSVVGPLPATGTVTFRDTVSSGARNGQTVTLGTAAVSNGTAALTVALPAFGRNTITASYGGDATHSGQVSVTRQIEVSATVGQLIVREFRLSGPAGAADQFVELYNTGVPIPVAGFRVLGGGGATLTLPASAPTVGTGRSYLVTGADHSLGGVAPADASAPTLGTGGLQVVAPDTAGTATDAVGSSTYTSGTALPTLSGTPTDEYAWVRRYGSGRPRDTRDNRADFMLVSTTGAQLGGVQSMLGSPSPAGTVSPFQHNAALRSVLLDPGAAVGAAPNRVYQPGPAGSPGTLTVRRIITNSSDTAVTSVQLRVISLSEANGAPRPDVAVQPARVALLRLVDAPAQTSTVPLTGGGTVTVRNLVPDPPSGSSAGGGMASTLAVSLPGGSLAAGDSVAIAVTFAVDRSGTFWFGYNVDALDSAGVGLRATGTRTGRPTVTVAARPAAPAPWPGADGPLARDTGRIG
jgi:large repetitive protein